jgi:hypothetical protein
MVRALEQDFPLWQRRIFWGGDFCTDSAQEFPERNAYGSSSLHKGSLNSGHLITKKGRYYV